MKRQIVLEVTIRAISTSEEYIPQSTAAEEVVMLTIPNMEYKFVVFPKVLEGLTISVIKAHQDNVRSYLSEKADEERKRNEYAQLGLPYPPVSRGAPVPFDNEEDGDDSESDDSDDDASGDEDNDPSFRIDFDKIARDAMTDLDVELTSDPTAEREA